MSQNHCIGVFDSGVGGLSVLRHIRALLPAEDLAYIADSGYAPYGNKSPELIRERSAALTEFLLARNAKAIVVACNTATAAAAAFLREKYDVPIIAMEPAVKPAVAATKSGVVGVLATVGTLRSARFAALLEHFAKDVEVVTQSCPGLVEQIERGELHSTETRNLLQQFLTPLLQKQADTIVLGCTHYPFLRPLIEELAGPQVSIIETGAAVARQLKKRLMEAGLLKDQNKVGSELFWTTGELQNARLVFSSLWQADAQVETCCPLTLHA